MQDPNHWYSLKSSNTGEHTYHTQDPALSSSVRAPAGIHDPHALPGVYSFTSLTPTTHGEASSPSLSQPLTISSPVSRHLSHLSMGTHTASYAQPHYYTTNGYHHPSPNPPPYTEYATESNRLQSFRHPESHSSYWTTAASDTSRYLGGQSNRHVFSLPP
jgi:hypothetical protein